MRLMRITLLLAILAGTGCATWDIQRQIDRLPWRRDKSKPEAPAFPPAPTADNPLGLPDGTQWVHGRNITHWPEIFTMHGATVHPHPNGVNHRVTLSYSGLQDIPAWNVPGDPNNVHNVNGNVWFVREFRGQWYIGTFEYLRVGQTNKDMSASPAWMFMPESGDWLGFMVSTLARHPKENGTIADGVTYQGRSNIVWVTWP